MAHSPNESLLAAAAAGNVDEVNRLLSDGADANAQQKLAFLL